MSKSKSKSNCESLCDGSNMELYTQEAPQETPQENRKEPIFDGSELVILPIKKTRVTKTPAKKRAPKIEAEAPKVLETVHEESECEPEWLKKGIDISEDFQSNINKIAKDVLSACEPSILEHLGDYIEEPYHLIESYFQGKHLERLVRHQIESYNHFINYQILRTIQMFNPVTVHSENDYVAAYQKYFLEVVISFENFKLYPPQIHENNGATKLMFPQEAKLRNFTYASVMTVDIKIDYVIRNTESMDTPKIITKILPKINIGKMPIMLKSNICILTQNNHVHPILTGECPMDCGGYFIIKGSEKTVLGQERAAENRVYCFDGKNTAKWSWFAEIKSVPDYKCISPKQIEMMVASKNNGFGNGIYITIPRIKAPIELFVLFRALGVISDKSICEYILLDVNDEKYRELANCLQASIIDANKYMTKEDALRHITASVAYTPINMDKETGARKKHEFALEVLNNDLFPHCRTLPQKLYLLGYMAKKLLQTSLGWIGPDDRDSYLNKRIELTGTLLNNLFRNYFNKLVKEMQKQIVREINNGSWRSTEDYENIVNMTNIYKIMKSTTIENGINRALSTGDFSIKQANSSKVGVAQVLNRLTYVASLSHLRRINTPLEKSGELIAPRKLHNTTWGFLCPAETPEGQSIGVVKNISYMAHITIPTNSSSLYEYVKSSIIPVDDANPVDLHNKVKLFINGCWVGIAPNPIELFHDIKDKKYRGIINIYTSIVFDYKSMEIRICNDGGRLTRPVLRVKNNRALITQDIINKIEKKELAWNDLVTSCRIDESVIEYIDPEEQNYSMIAMKAKDDYLQDMEYKINYTHCEIHPSTIFGVLASCIPYPEHNQAPRNTYQCAMGKQAIGVYSTNYDQRMDKTAYVLSYPSRPLVDTRLMNFIHLNKIPSGTQIHVAIMSHTGYNQEDSVLVNKGSIDRGLFMATIYHTEKDEDKNIIRDEIIRCKPDPLKTKGIKFGNYSKLNSQGFIPENTLVENRDVIIAKTVPIKENRNDPTKTVKYEDQSKTFRTNEETYIDKNYTGRNGDGYNFAKVRVRILRKPVLGDKFCALPTQQVLTDRGWVEIQSLDIDEHKVCTLDKKGKMCYEFPSAKYEYDHDDKMYLLENQDLKIICTLNHKLYVKTDDTNGEYGLLEAQNVMGNPAQFQKTMENVYPKIVSIQMKDGLQYNMDIWLKIMAMYFAYGVHNPVDKNVCFQNVPASKINILHTPDFNYGLFVCGFSDKEPSNYYISEKNSETLYYELCTLKPSKKSGSKDHWFPSYVWKLSKQQCILLLHWFLRIGREGTIPREDYEKSEETCCYRTISPVFADELSRLALHCGYSANIVYEHGHYCVYITDENQPYINTTHSNRNDESTFDYIGKVYCIEMPSSHTYYMRESNSSPPVIVGNSSRHGQKGTCGNIIPECDMPFTKDGLRPDIIINPHAIPSRMTIGQLKETLLGKVLLELGMFGDGTSFGNLDVKTISEELQKLGYESYGNEVLYNGLTGEQLETNIFIGPVFYQRLKHMVSDKQHSRSFGPMVNLTRQPAEGRSRDGGFRIGEMERDVMIAHGMSRFCRERLYDVSDKYSTYVCKRCGMIAAYNDCTARRMHSKDDMTVHKCNTCDNLTEFARVEIPYAYKLLSQELQTINIVPRLITE